MATNDWIIGIGVAFLIATIMTIAVSIKDGKLEVNGKVFILFLSVGFAISVYGDLLDFWYFVVSFLLSLFIIFNEIYQKGIE